MTMNSKPTIKHVSNASCREGEHIEFQVHLTSVAPEPTWVGLRLADGSARAGCDFKPRMQLSYDEGRSFHDAPLDCRGTSVPTGCSRVDVRIPTVDNCRHEGDQTFELHASCHDSHECGTGLICDNHPAPTVQSVSNASALEGLALTFDVHLTAASAKPTTVSLALNDGTASHDTDYSMQTQVSFDGGHTFSPVSGTSVTVPAGVTGFQVRVASLDDKVFEGDEGFSLKATANGGSASGTGTIIDNDGSPGVSSVSNAHASEGDPLVFDVSLGGVSSKATTVELALADGSAKAGTDYRPAIEVSFDGGNTYGAVTGTSVSVPAGAGGFKVRVASIEDNTPESSESFQLTASTANSKASGTGTICDDDFAPTVRTVSSPTANEGDALEFDVTLSGATPGATRIDLAFHDGSAKAGVDFQTNPQASFDGGKTWFDVGLNATSVTVPAGVTGFKLRVPSVEDSIHEGNETFSLVASANGSQASGTGTICDNDGPPTIASIGSATATEGDALVFDVALSGASTSATSVTLSLADGTAHRGDDYRQGYDVSFDGGHTYTTVTGSTVDVPAGATGFMVKVATIQDSLFESTETFTLGASANGSTATATGTILDNEHELAVVGVTSAQATEGSPLVFEVTVAGSTAICHNPPGSQNPPDNWTFTQNGGSASIDLGGYRIDLQESNSTWILTNKATGACTRIWGDPHVDEANNGTTDFDFHKDATFQLSDWTKITVHTVAFGNTGQTLSSELVITDWCDNNAIVVRGLGMGYDGSNNLTIEKHYGEGQALDLANVDGAFTLHEANAGGWVIYDGRTANQTLINQFESGTLSDPTATVALKLADGTATSTLDYANKLEVSFDGGKTYTLVADPEHVQVPAHSGSFLVRVASIDDKLIEDNETFTLTASAKGGTAAGTGTIIDDDFVTPVHPVVHSVGNAAAHEGDSLVFAVTLSGVSTVPTHVELGLADGTATAGADYKVGYQVSFDGGQTFTPVAGSGIDIPAGKGSFLVSVASLDDKIFEGGETFTLSATANGGAATGTGTICDDETAPTVVSVGNAAANEGDPLVFAVTMSGVSATPTHVELGLADGTATSGADYKPSYEVSFDAGKTFTAVTGSGVDVPAGHADFQVRVASLEDKIAEGNETFTLSASANGASATGTGTICDNDAAPTVVSVGNAAAHEGDPLVFAVTMSGVSASPTHVELGLADGTATAGADYKPTYEVSFDGGKTFTAVTGSGVDVPAGHADFQVRVASIQDKVFEGDETFKLSATANGASATGTGTICDDDAAPTVISVGNAAANEGDPLVFAVTMSGVSATPTHVELGLADGTATAGADYKSGYEVSFDGGKTFTAVTGSGVDVPAGHADFQVRVASLTDKVFEGNETFTLHAAANGSGATGTGTICDIDTAPQIVSVGNATANEGDPLVFAVALSSVSSTTTHVELGLADGTATAGADYKPSYEVSFDGGKTFTAVTGSGVDVPAGHADFQVRVASLDDNVFEGNETFTLNASTNGSSAHGTGTIVDNDIQSTVTVVSVSSVVVYEGEDAPFLVQLSSAATGPAQVQLGLHDGTAKVGEDYGNSLEVSFDGKTWTSVSNGLVDVPAGSSSFTVRVHTVLDTIREPIESFTLTAQTGTVEATGVGTILNGTRPIDPLVIDMNGDGVHTLGIEAGVRFDMNNDGRADRTGWIDKNDAFLVSDANHNGQIDQQSEMFGSDKAASGFAELASYDSNQDGQVDAKDARFDELQVWQDKNSDGKTEAGELISLSAAGIASLKVAYQSQANMDGTNVVAERSTATFTDGHTSETADVNFTMNLAGSRPATATKPMPKLADLLGDSRDDAIPLPAKASQAATDAHSHRHEHDQHGAGQPADGQHGAGRPDGHHGADSLTDATLNMDNLLHKAPHSHD